jgi:hypothetical protein
MNDTVPEVLTASSRVLNIYKKGNQIKLNAIGGACSMQGAMRNAYIIIVGKYEGKLQLRRPRCR